MTTKQDLIDAGNDEKAVQAYIDAIDDKTLDQFEESYQGYWPSDEDFVKQLLEDTEETLKNLPLYIHIDWESTARDIMMDYTEYEGHYFRKF